MTQVPFASTKQPSSEVGLVNLSDTPSTQQPSTAGGFVSPTCDTPSTQQPSTAEGVVSPTGDTPSTQQPSTVGGVVSPTSNTSIPPGQLILFYLHENVV